MLRTQHLASLETAPLKAILDGGVDLPTCLAKKIAPISKIVKEGGNGVLQALKLLL
jgi:hypothetical protein